MSWPLLLDEMLTSQIADQIGRMGHDVTSVVGDTALTSLPDDQILDQAIREGRALVTLNVRDFLILDGRLRAQGRSHAGLVLVSTRSFPQDRSFVGAMVNALAKLLDQPDSLGPEQVVFLQR